MVSVKKILKSASYLALALGAASAFSSSSATTLGTLATTITTSFEQFGELMLGIAFVAGIGFVIAAVFKFKQHKDNPTQVPIGTPFSLLAIGVALIFIPSFIAPAGATIFGSKATVGGFTGTGVDVIT